MSWLDLLFVAAQIQHRFQRKAWKKWERKTEKVIIYWFTRGVTEFVLTKPEGDLAERALAYLKVRDFGVEVVKYEDMWGSRHTHIRVQYMKPLMPWP